MKQAAQQLVPVVSGIANVLKDGMDHFMEGMPGLMKALDHVERIHPFIGGKLHLGIHASTVYRSGFSGCHGFPNRI